MKKLFIFLSMLIAVSTSHAFIPIASKFTKIPDVAEYKKGDWNNMLGVMKGLSVNQALQYASLHSEVTFFFYITGMELVLELDDGNYKVFEHGDAVFFKGNPWWGSCPGQSDGYIRVQN